MKKYSSYIDSDLVQEITQIATKAGVDAFIRENKKYIKQNDKASKAKRMLGSYRRIKEMLQDADEDKTDAEQIELRWRFIEDMMSTDGIVETATETEIKDSEKRLQENLYYAHRIEKAIELYKTECENSNNPEAVRRWRILHMHYIDENKKSIEEIAEIENISDRTVYNDLNTAYKIIAVYMLGI